MHWVVDELMGTEKLEWIQTSHLKNLVMKGKGNCEHFSLNFNYCLEYWYTYKGPSKIIASNSNSDYIRDTLIPSNKILQVVASWKVIILYPAKAGWCPP